jgi:nitrous oxidase accessory protein
VVLLTGLLFLQPSLSDAGRVTVCPSCPVDSISKGLAIANPGDTIFVKDGLYKEGNIVIDKRVVLLGLNMPQVDGDMEHEIFTVTADSVTIQGFQLQNIGTNYIKDLAAINVKGALYCNIIGNRLINTFFGIYLQNTRDCILKDNYIEGEAVKEISSGNAIHLWYCKNITIDNNEVRNHRDGIYLEFVDDSRITNNISVNNLRYGLHFMFSNYDEYLGNKFESNGAGVAVMFSKGIQMKGNKFVQNWGSASYGLLLKEITDGEISRNEFSQNTIGIYAESANRMQIVDNDFTSNGWALKIMGSSVDNTFSKNNFINNTFDLTFYSSVSRNTYSYNYWSEYTGYDLNYDGIGDVPHRPIQLFSHVVSRVPTSIVLLRSLFVDVINFAETVAPIFSPESLIDESPAIRKFVR